VLRAEMRQLREHVFDALQVCLVEGRHLSNRRLPERFVALLLAAEVPECWSCAGHRLPGEPNAAALQQDEARGREEPAARPFTAAARLRGY